MNTTELLLGAAKAADDARYVYALHHAPVFLTQADYEVWTQADPTAAELERHWCDYAGVLDEQDVPLLPSTASCYEQFIQAKCPYEADSSRDASILQAIQHPEDRKAVSRLLSKMPTGLQRYAALANKPTT